VPSSDHPFPATSTGKRNCNWVKPPPWQSPATNHENKGSE